MAPSAAQPGEPRRPLRSVLIIAYHFPPLGGPGVQRTLGFARHLPAEGWRPTVVTSDGRGYWAQDPGLLDRLPTSVDVVRVPEGRVGQGIRAARRWLPARARPAIDRALFVPDLQVTWAPAAARAALAAARREPPEVVFATGAPWSSLLVGRAVARRLGRPLLADLRDPWTDGTVFRPASPAHRRLHRALEGAVHRDAAWVVANTQGNLDALRESFPVTRAKSSFIPNGWDEPDFAEVGPRTEEVGLRVGFAGNFYAGRDGADVLALFAEAAARTPDLARRLRLRFVGRTEVRAAARVAGLSVPIEELGYRPLPRALALLAECRAGLVTVPAEAHPGWVPQKLYQQLRLGQPILTLAPPGDAARLTVEAGQRWIDLSGPDPAGQLAAALVDVEAGRVASPPPAMVARYDRRRLTEALARRLDACAPRPASGPA